MADELTDAEMMILGAVLTRFLRSDEPYVALVREVRVFGNEVSPWLTLDGSVYGLTEREAELIDKIRSD